VPALETALRHGLVTVRSSRREGRLGAALSPHATNRQEDRMFKLTTALIAVTAIAAATAIAAVAAGGSTTYKDKIYAPLRGAKVTVPGHCRVDERALGCGWRYPVFTGSFQFWAPNWGVQGDNVGARIFFVADPHPSAGDGTMITTISTPAAIVSYLRHDPKLIASGVKSRRIAGFRALGIDVHQSPNAGKDEGYLQFKPYSEGCCYGTGSTTGVRMYFATIGGGHVLAAVVEGTPLNAFRKVLPTASKIISTLELPQRLRH
jgi:hypothetical protein